MNKDIILAPSILSADFSSIREELNEVKSNGCKWVHLDVMDGCFVPNITFGPKFIKDIRKHSRLFFDTHLMIDEPSRYIRQFAEAGSDCITVHQEACKDVRQTLDIIHQCNSMAGISICPETDVHVLDEYLNDVQLVLVMTVHPGFGGQELIEDCLEKVKYLKSVRGNRNYLISVDGGINGKTAAKAIGSGIDVAVAGSAFFGAEDKLAFVNGFKTGKF